MYIRIPLEQNCIHVELYATSALDSLAGQIDNSTASKDKYHAYSNVNT